MPSSTRPPDRWSSEATVLACTIGSCWATSVMPVPSRSRSVTVAGGGEGDERVEGAAVLLGQLGSAGPRRAPARRDVGVLGDPERLEAAGLQLGRQAVGADRQVGREDQGADVHPRRLYGVGRPERETSRRRAAVSTLAGCPCGSRPVDVHLPAGWWTSPVASRGRRHACTCPLCASVVRDRNGSGGVDAVGLVGRSARR